MTRACGRAPRSRRQRMGQPHGHWKTTTFVAGLTLGGMIAPFVLDGPINRLAFETCVDKVLVPELRAGDIVVTDNLSGHKGTGVRESIEEAAADLLFPPPCRPAAPISTRSRWPSPGSRRSCARPPNGPWTACGQRSHPSSKPSPPGMPKLLRRRRLRSRLMGYRSIWRRHCIRPFDRGLKQALEGRRSGGGAARRSPRPCRLCPVRPSRAASILRARCSGAASPRGLLGAGVARPQEGDGPPATEPEGPYE